MTAMTNPAIYATHGRITRMEARSNRKPRAARFRAYGALARGMIVILPCLLCGSFITAATVWQPF